ncbi:unnamed protein product [Schistosoma curassoni]|nr:unnamed protein product [Schistosoma curassoni]
MMKQMKHNLFILPKKHLHDNNNEQCLCFIRRGFIKFFSVTNTFLVTGERSLQTWSQYQLKLNLIFKVN